MSADSPSSPPPPTRNLAGDARAGALPSALGWGGYLASSWTWCIGMFLPVLLVRDYGLLGWVVFAVPNVLGAAAMGFVLRSRSASRRITRRHAPMLGLFSIVTVVFQIFFLVSLTKPSAISAFAGVPSWMVLPIAVGLVLFAVPGRGAWWGLLVWLASTAFLVTAAVRGSIATPAGTVLAPWIESATRVEDLAFLAPVCAFGFALCPYLDLTFHRARQSLGPVRSRAAFGFGFGVLFLLMIVGTLGYTGLALTALGTGEPVDDTARLLIGLHIALQLLFTCAVHILELLNRIPPAITRRLFWPLLALCIGSALGLALDRGYSEPDRLPLWEITYRLFMSFYGLIFPAYVWLCVIPVRGEPHTARPSRRKLAVLAAACLIAAPFFWMGFIERQTVWLAPGLGIVLLARLLIPRRPQ